MQVYLHLLSPCDLSMSLARRMVQDKLLKHSDNTCLNACLISSASFIYQNNIDYGIILVNIEMTQKWILMKVRHIVMYKTDI